MKIYDGKTILTIIGIVSLAILAFVFLVGYILSNIDPDNKLEGYIIAISFIGIFATFGGAYLGAKISGENASKLAKKESMINDLNRTMESNNKVLENFNNKNLKRTLDFYSNKNDLKNTFEVNNFIVNFFEFKEKFRHFKLNNNFESTFPLISYDFKELETRIKYLGDELWKYNDEINNYLEELIKKYGLDNHTILGKGSGLALYKRDDDYMFLETKYMEQKVNIDLEISEVNKAINSNGLRNINDAIDDFKEYWAGFKFKTKDDIRDFIAEYYGGYQ